MSVNPDGWLYCHIPTVADKRTEVAPSATNVEVGGEVGCNISVALEICVKQEKFFRLASSKNDFRSSVSAFKSFLRINSRNNFSCSKFT